MSFPSVEGAHTAVRVSQVPPIMPAFEHIYGEVDDVLRTMRLHSGAAVLQGCLPLLLQEVAAEQLIARIGQERYERFLSCYREMEHLNLWYSVELRRILAAMRSAEIPVMILKGADLAATCYPRPGLRCFDDIDLMVQPGDLRMAQQVLEQQGYSYHQEYRFESISKRRSGFVYVKAVAAGYLMFELHTAPHMNELGVSFDVPGIWQRARAIMLQDVPIYGMGLEDLFIFLCWHYRSHYFGRLIWLYDIALLLSIYKERFDWELLYQLARQQGLLATIYYVAHWCEQLFQIPLPSGIERYAPPRVVQWLIKRLTADMLVGKVYPITLRKRKFLQYLAVDDVKTLCYVQLRVLFPSTTHLGRLYMEHSRLPLHFFWLYYLVHPWFVLSTLFKFTARRSKQRP